MRKIKKICLVGGEYSALVPNAGGASVGGEAIQHMLLAKALRDHDIDVTMVVPNVGQPDRVTVDGIEVLSTCSQSAGLPVLRFVHPRMTSLLAALKRADADVYYQSPAGVATGWTAWFCRRHSRQFVFRVASDANCIPGQQLIKYWRDRKIYEYGLYRAEKIAAQTERQVTLLRQNYKVQSSVVNMIVEAPEKGSLKRDIDVLWVSNLRGVKHPEKLLEIARALPTLKFVMVGGQVPSWEKFFDEIRGAAAEIPNLEFVGSVAYSRVREFFGRAKVFINTSSVEGFPNTFLQAWIHRVPVVSFFDPDGLIRSRKLGIVPDDLTEMWQTIEKAVLNPRWLIETGERSHRFVVERFSANTVVDQYMKLLGE